MTYSKEFKQQAIKLSDEIGTQKACEQLGLSYFTLGGWRKKENRKRIMDEKTAENITTPLTEREKKLLKYIHIRSLITRIFCVYFINLNYLFLMHTTKKTSPISQRSLKNKEKNNLLKDYDSINALNLSLREECRKRTKAFFSI
jgi:transposase-like protein